MEEREETKETPTALSLDEVGSSSSGGRQKGKKRDKLGHARVPYLLHRRTWPRRGRHILAQYTDDAVVVYQAYNPQIGHYAAEHKKFVGAPGWRTRMTWIKTNFLWMMYRSGWGDKRDQEVTLAIWLKREAFEYILEKAVHSGYVKEIYPDKEEWDKAFKTSGVRLQWDPDHTPDGSKLERRAIQLGLSGEVAEKYASGEWFMDVMDISDFVAEQNPIAQSKAYQSLMVAEERIFIPSSSEVIRKLGLATWNPASDDKEEEG